MTLFITGTYKLTIQNKETEFTGFYKYLSLPFEGPYSLDTLNRFLEDFIYQQLSQCYYNFHVENVMITSWKEYNPDGPIIAKDIEILEISRAEYLYYNLPPEERGNIKKADFIKGIEIKNEKI